MLSPEVAAAHRGLKILSGLYLLLLIGVAGYVYARHSRDVLAGPRVSPVLATVEGESITDDQMDSFLRARYSVDALNHLVEARLIDHAAKQQNLSLDDSASLLKIQNAGKNAPDGYTAGVQEDEMRTHLQLRKLVLKDWTEDDEQALYDAFKEQFYQYDVNAMLTAQSAVARKVVDALRRQGADFDTLVENYCVDAGLKAVHGKLGLVTVSQLEQQFGPKVAGAVGRAQANSVLEPIRIRTGYMVVQLRGVRTSFEDLAPALDDVAFLARRDQVLHNLLRNSHIDSPYLVRRTAQATASPDAGRH